MKNAKFLSIIKLLSNSRKINVLKISRSDISILGVLEAYFLVKVLLLKRTRMYFL